MHIRARSLLGEAVSTSEILRATGVDLSCGARPAVRGAQLSVARGEVVAIAGQSGSGKSSLLYCLAGTRADAQLVLSSGSEAERVREVLDGIAAVAPIAEVELIGVNIQGLEQIAVIETLLAVGMIMGLVIGVAAFVVTATDRAVERRPQITAVMLIGARARTVRTVQCVQVVLPLTIGLVLALVTGKLAESSYLITGGSAVYWDLAGTPLLALAAAGVVAVAIAGTLPLAGRRVDPELIRRD
ncbi:ATP-binding cassette domain-containing protein [Streptomyces wuyuanensis]|uniref:ATP-binding cassette domain-containing protein n=1 Tax=Streptomyces wuyuanensis TaxID=1196353 RepID=UPI00371895D4